VPAPQQRRAAVSMKTLLSDKPQVKLCLPHPRGASVAGAMPPGEAPPRRQGPVRLGHITTLSSPFNQLRRGRPRRIVQSSPNVGHALARLHLSPARLELCRWWR